MTHWKNIGRHIYRSDSQGNPLSVSGGNSWAKETLGAIGFFLFVVVCLLVWAGSN